MKIGWKQNKLRERFLLTSIIATAVIFSLVLGIILWGLNRSDKAKAMEISQMHSQKYALAVKAFFDFDIGLAKGLANILQYKGNYSEELRDSIYAAMMSEILKTSPNCISVWGSLELKQYQQGYTQEHGRKLIATIRESNDNIVVNEYFRDMESPNPGSDYFKIKEDAIPVITEPYIDTDVGNFLITSVIYPIFLNDEFAGISGLDIPLDSIQEIITQTKLIEGSNAFVFSNSGIILGHSNPDLIGVNLEQCCPEYIYKYNILEKIKNTENISFIRKEAGKEYFNSVSPFLVNGTNTFLGVCVSIPETIILSKAKARKTKFFILGIIGLILVVGILIYYSRSIEKPIAKSIRIIDELAHGNIQSTLKLDINARGNLGAMEKSVNLLIDNLKKTVKFVQEIENGNLDYQFESLGTNDKLGDALAKMRLGMIKHLEEDEKRHEKDQQVTWTAEGLTKLAAILQTDASDLGRFTYNIVSFLTQYSQATQGAIYLINNTNNEDIYIELTASYGLSKIKLENKRIELEEGLIGACIKEKKTKYLTKIPDNYVQIESSLGKAKPSSILIAPILNSTEVIGAIELASFEEIKYYQTTFIESACESIGLIISSTKLQLKTKVLLEESYMQAEQMAIQEEEMREIMEKMLVTQKETEQKEHKLQKILQELGFQESEMKQKIEEIKKMC